VYDDTTGAYVRSGKLVGESPPAGPRPAWAFWDPRVAAWRIKQEDLVLIELGARFFGKDKQDFPLRTYSITVSMTSGDVPSSFVPLMVDWCKQNGAKYALAVERGTKENNRHLQVFLGTRGSLDSGTLKEMAARIKAALMVARGDGVQVCAKLHDNPKFLLGYVQKVT
jgi:hypothetical protein